MNKVIAKWEAGESTDIVLKVREAQIQQLYRQTWISLTGVLIVTFSICFVLWQVIPQWKLSLWAGVLGLLTIARGFVMATFQRKPRSGTDMYRWAKLHVIGVTSSGVMWALPSIFLWPHNSPTHQLIWPICIVSLAAAGVASYFTWTPSYLSFLILSVVPISFRLISEDSLVYVVLGLLGLFLTVFLTHTGKMMHAASVRTFLVGIRNEALNSFLSDKKMKQEQLNMQLHLEVAERTLSQEELRLRNQELEQLNTQLTTTKNHLESANKELERALINIKQLSGMLPICASCKKIRNDKGYWEQIEAYLRDHAEVEFSHSICPECTEKLYPDIFNEK